MNLNSLSKQTYNYMGKSYRKSIEKHFFAYLGVYRIYTKE